ncbi:MAG: STAS-like domain-containing protein [Bacteroidia bacterium]|nr:STAS-like domain-containing protein [Bacteroidia bacterium]
MDYYRDKGITFEIIGAIPYLKKTCFNNPLQPNEKANNAKRFLDKVWTFSNSRDVYNITTGLIDHLRRSTECEKGVIESCDWGINEIMDNVIQHSEAEKGFIMAQVNEKTKILNVTIFDYGVGIYKTMKGSKPSPRNVIDAISLSVQEGKKGKKSTGQGNGMWGLYNIVDNNSGHLTIVSGEGGIHFRDKKTSNLKDVRFLNYKNQATNIHFHINLNKETLITDAIKGYVFVDLYLESLEDNQGRSIYKIREVASGTGTRASAEEIRNALINIYTDTRKPVIIDFEGVGIISSSFADELVGKLIIKLGFYQYQRIFQIINMNQTIQSILHRSVSQRIAQEFFGIADEPATDLNN